METTGGRLKRLRKEAGLTGTELGQKFGEVTSAISDYENDKRVPIFDTLLKYAELGHVSIDWILCRSNVRNADQELQARNYPNDVLTLAEKLSALANGERRGVIDFAYQLIDGFAVAKAAQLRYLDELIVKRGGAGAAEDFRQRTGVNLHIPS